MYYFYHINRTYSPAHVTSPYYSPINVESDTWTKQKQQLAKKTIFTPSRNIVSDESNIVHAVCAPDVCQWCACVATFLTHTHTHILKCRRKVQAGSERWKEIPRYWWRQYCAAILSDVQQNSLAGIFVPSRVLPLISLLHVALTSETFRDI